MIHRTTWRQILKQKGPGFLEWLSKAQAQRNMLTRISDQLQRYLIATVCSSEDAITFWKTIPIVRAACNDQATYEKPFSAECYAYVHFLERYRRMWAVLKHLTYLSVLPLGQEGVRTLDIGTGPAPVLFAIDDFYSSLREYAEKKEINELIIPPPALDSVELSSSMAQFLHHFAESCGRCGPFSPTFRDFSSLNLAATRQEYFTRWKSESYWDPETEQFEEYYDPVAANVMSSRLFRYRLVILSNFLTLSETVEKFRGEISMLFSDLGSGAIVIVLGGTNDSYQQIYEEIVNIATSASFVKVEWDTNQLGSTMQNEDESRIIKSCQYNVYKHFVDLAGEDAFCRDTAWPDYWNPEPSPLARTKFALRVFRKGKWPLIH